VDPVADLGGVTWASLHGTFGSAEAVPGQIQALRSPDSGVRHAALDELSNAVIHQGTRWQVSAHVVPFLVRLIDHPDTPDRGALTKLMRHVGLGLRDDLDLPFDPEASFAGAQMVTKEQEDLVTWRVYHLEDEFTEDWVDIADACANKWDADAYWAAAAHVSTYCRWLADDDPEVASRAAELLTWFPPAESTTAALLSVDGDDSVRASANLALAHLNVPSAAAAVRMTSLLDHDSFVVRVTAAVALAYRHGQDLPDRVLDILIEAKEREPLPAFPPGWHQRAQLGFVALALQSLGLG
jgi:HEAT repeat protein